MGMARIAEELQGQERPEGAGRRDHLRAGETRPRQEGVQPGVNQPGEEEEQAAELGAEVARRQVKAADVGHVGDDRAGLVGPFVVGASRQLGEALVLEDRGDRRRTERLSVAGQGAADIMDREVLLAQGDYLLPQPFLLAGWPPLACRWCEEIAVGLVAELVDEDAEAPRRVAKASGDLSRW